MLGRPWITLGGCELEYSKLPGIQTQSLGRPHRSLFPILTELHRHPLMKVYYWGTLIQNRCKSIYLVSARVICCTLWRLLRSKLSRYERLQHQRKFPGIAVPFNLIPIRFIWYKICQSTTVNKVSMRNREFISRCTNRQNPSLNNQGRWQWVIYCRNFGLMYKSFMVGNCIICSINCNNKTATILYRVAIWFVSCE